MQDRNRDADVENRFADTGKKRVGWIERVVALKHTSQYVKYTANGKMLYSTGSSAQGSVVTLEDCEKVPRKKH